MSSAEFLATLQAWASDTLEVGDWDYFECRELSDPRLEAIRKKCALMSLDPAFTVNPQESWRLSESGKDRVRELIAEVRGQGSVAAQLFNQADR